MRPSSFARSRLAPETPPTWTRLETKHPVETRHNILPEEISAMIASTSPGEAVRRRVQRLDEPGRCSHTSNRKFLARRAGTSEENTLTLGKGGSNKRGVDKTNLNCCKVRNSLRAIYESNLTPRRQANTPSCRRDELMLTFPELAAQEEQTSFGRHASTTAAVDVVPDREAGQPALK